MEDINLLDMHVPKSWTCYAREYHLGEPSPVGLSIQNLGCDQKSTYIRTYSCVAIICMTNLKNYRGAVINV